MALRDLVSAIPARLLGLNWLLNSAGKESNWFWKWKFRTADRHVRFDPNRCGWPWFPNTVSWVFSTAFAILALAAYRRPCSSLSSSLAAFPDLSGTEDTSMLALVCLALDQQRALEAFGVSV